MSNDGALDVMIAAKYPNACEHSLLACGECTKERPVAGNGMMRVQVSGEHWKDYLAFLQFKQQAAATPPPVPAVVAPTAPPLRLDLGCGKNKKEGFLGVDCLDFPGVDVKLDMGKDRWPWSDGSVDEVHCAHTAEHLPWHEVNWELDFGGAEPILHNLKNRLRKVVTWPRAHFFNELWRVLKPGAKATIVVPHWASCRHWGDPTHASPVAETTPWYLNRGWRNSDAPHTNDILTCDFDCTTPGYSWHSELSFRNEEYKQYAMHWFKEAAQDMVFTLLCRK